MNHTSNVNSGSAPHEGSTAGRAYCRTAQPSPNKRASGSQSKSPLTISTARRTCSTTNVVVIGLEHALPMPWRLARYNDTNPVYTRPAKVTRPGARGGRFLRGARATFTCARLPAVQMVGNLLQRRSRSAKYSGSALRPRYSK